MKYLVTEVNDVTRVWKVSLDSRVSPGGLQG